MTDFDDEISKIFDARNEREQQQKLLAEKTRAEREVAREAFMSFRDAVVVPVFESVAKTLEGRGVTARVEKDEDARLPGIKITMLRNGDNERGGNIIPALAIHWDGSDEVRFHKSSGSPSGGSMSGGDGSMKMAEVSQDTIRGKLLTIIRESFA